MNLSSACKATLVVFFLQARRGCHSLALTSSVYRTSRLPPCSLPPNRTVVQACAWAVTTGVTYAERRRFPGWVDGEFRAGCARGRGYAAGWQLRSGDGQCDYGGGHVLGLGGC